jgi:D-glycero-D-manno-heptose 1,7-bisphosphate phosphatase
MFNAFSKEYNRPLSDLYYVGDKLADIQAAEAVGAKPILVKTGKGLETLENNPEISSPIFENLYDAAKFITA